MSSEPMSVADAKQLVLDVFNQAQRDASKLRPEAIETALGEFEWAVRESAPATPAATPMAGNGYETAAVMRDLFREWWDKHDTATKLRKPQEMTAFQRIQNAFYAGALAIMDRQRAVAMNSEAPEKPIAPST